MALCEPPFCPARMLVGADDGAVDVRHRVGHVLAQRLEDTDPYAFLRPAIEPVVDRPIGAVTFGKITPRRARAQDVEDAVDDTSVSHPARPAARSGKVR